MINNVICFWFQAPFSPVQNNPHHPGDSTNHRHSTSASTGTGGSGKHYKGSQIKEKSSKSNSSTPVAHFGKKNKQTKMILVIVNSTLCRLGGWMENVFNSSKYLCIHVSCE